ncbi:MAG TPA: carbonic anhydrase, partial [Caulifigura sp.]|nr:carbonic anhydrase [Caulifigura sp.]
VKHGFDEEIHYVDYVDREVQGRMTPQRVFDILNEGNQRFRTGRHLTRDFSKQAQATALGQHPLACILGCIDSRSPTELVFDAGLGDLFSVRIAGNVVSRKVLGSIEYACSVGGAKLVVVMGHTRCGAVGAAVTLLSNSLDGQLPEQARQDHVQYIVDTIAPSIDETTRQAVRATNGDERQGLIDGVAQRHVSRMIESIREESPVLNTLERQGRIAIVGAMYDVRTGAVAFMTRPAVSPVVAGG